VVSKMKYGRERSTVGYARNQLNSSALDGAQRG
jgi:hypothetical protein